MCAGGKVGKTHLLLLLMSNGLRTVPSLFIFLVINNSDESGFLARRVFVRFVSSPSCRKPFHVLHGVTRLVKLCLTYSTGFWPLRLVKKPRLVSARARGQGGCGRTACPACPARGRATFSFPSPLGNLLAYKLPSLLCKGDDRQQIKALLK